MNTERAKLLLTEGDISIIADYESYNAKVLGHEAEYAVVRGYNQETKSWRYALEYTMSKATAYAVLAEAMGNTGMIKSESERRSGISYDRMSEIATRFKDACMESEDKEPLGYALEELDLTEKERKYFEIWDYAPDEEDEWYDE